MARVTVDELLAEARLGLERAEPATALAALARGAVLIDLRSADERRRQGIIPGSLHIPRSVLEWRVDPDSALRNRAAPGLDAELVLFCSDGYSSSLAAASLRRLGFAHATDMVGGFGGWVAAGLPTRPRALRRRRSPLLGMEPPEPLAEAESKPPTPVRP
jgi:rhodanese-related sulfurtransferase